MRDTPKGKEEGRQEGTAWIRVSAGRRLSAKPFDVRPLQAIRKQFPIVAKRFVAHDQTSQLARLFVRAFVTTIRTRGRRHSDHKLAFDDAARGGPTIRTGRRYSDLVDIPLSLEEAHLVHGQIGLALTCLRSVFNQRRTSAKESGALNGNTIQRRTFTERRTSHQALDFFLDLATTLIFLKQDDSGCGIARAGYSRATTFSAHDR